MVKFSGVAENVVSIGDKYSYYFDGEIFHLNRILKVNKPESFLVYKPVSIFELKKNNGGQVFVFNSAEQAIGLSNDNLIMKPSYMFVSENMSKPIDEFEGFVFYGSWINKIFPPSQIVKYDSLNYDQNKHDFFERIIDGSKTIELKKWAEVNKEFSYKVRDEIITISFNVESPGTIKEDDNNLGEINSCFELKFSKKHNISEIKEWYLKVRKFFQFITNRQDILFDKIYVLKSAEEGSFERVGFFHDLCNKNSNIQNKINKASSFFEHITELFKYVTNEAINFNYIPKNNQEYIYITAEQYINCCGSFEYNYRQNFVKSNTEDNKKNEVARDLELFLKSHKKYNRKQKRILKNTIEEIKKEGIEEKYNKCFKHYENTIKYIVEKMKIHYEIAKKPKQLGNRFASYRNHKAHGELNQLTSESICAYNIANVLIDCMILERCEYKLEEIETIINERYL